MNTELNDKTKRSCLMLTASMLIWATLGIFRRQVPLSSGLLACIRGLLGAFTLFVFMKLRGGKVRQGIGGKKLLLLALTGAVMGANWIFLFEAYNRTTIAAASLCYYMQPTITILLSPLVFRERLTGRKLICAFVSVCGMVLVSGVLESGGSGLSGLDGILCALSAAVFYSGLTILNKKIQMEDACEKTMIQLFSAAVLLIPYLLLTEKSGGIRLTAYSVLMVLIIGVVHTGAAFALYFASLPNLKAQTAAVLSYIDPIATLLFSAVFLKERLSPAGMAGAVMIIGAAAVSELCPSQERKKR